MMKVVEMGIMLFFKRRIEKIYYNDNARNLIKAKSTPIYNNCYLRCIGPLKFVHVTHFLFMSAYENITIIEM